MFVNSSVLSIYRTITEQGGCNVNINSNKKGECSDQTGIQ
jgi:hypothetical protein